ncbi:MAG TPA: 3-phosphoshikimate 1-carboxyvinyltransferase [Ilumatobacter sp.]|nr:3-phosphoshikimate 1-carboxyvinyltransferase [Ilumatobacter sp.]
MTNPPDAVVAVPGSKSIANRALVCAALARGRSELTNVPDGDDTLAILACLRGLGLDVELAGDHVSIDGIGVDWSPEPRTLHAALAGTTSRFVTALAALGSGPITIDGDPPLRRRPFGPLHDAITQLGVSVTAGEAYGHLPATVQGPPTSGRVRIRGDVSSQFVTALLLIGPYLPDGLELQLTSTLVSRPYVEMTAAVMAWFGVDTVTLGGQRIEVPQGEYRPAAISIEPDASSASYALAIAALTGGRVTVDGLGADSLQGDASFADVLSDMGCVVERTARSVTVRGSDELHGVDLDMADISDLVPTVAVVAAMATTPTRIRGVGFIREKESDRLGDLVHELRAAGVDVDETDDGLDVRPSRPHAARLGTHHDHRLAMAFAVLGTVVEGIEVEDPDVVTKSWPSFWHVLDGLTR